MTSPVSTRLRRRASGETGFTLIELLVVITILGILAAVVIFALGGIGDRGEKNAAAAEKRVIRTAQESYCAKSGEYATSVDQLMGITADSNGDKHKFLASRPKQADFDVQPGSGTCGGELDIYDDSTPPALVAGNGTIRVGAEPDHLALDPEHDRLYVSNSGSNSVSVIDTNTRRVVATIGPIGSSGAIAVNPGLDRVYVAGAEGGDQKVFVIDPTAGDPIVARVTYPGSGITGLAVNTTNDKAYACGEDSDQLMAIDGTTNARSFMNIAEACGGTIAVNNPANKIYVFTAEGLKIVTGAGDSVTTLPFAGGGRTDGARANGLAVDEQSGTVYVTGGLADNGMRATWIVDGSGELRHTVLENGLRYRQTIVVDPGLSAAFVLSHFENSSVDNLSRLDGGGYTGQIPISTALSNVEPRGVAIDPGRHRIYLAEGTIRDGHQEGQLRVVNTDLTPNTVITFPQEGPDPASVHPQRIVVDPDTHDAYVTTSGTPGAVRVVR